MPLRGDLLSEIALQLASWALEASLGVSVTKSLSAAPCCSFVAEEAVPGSWSPLQLLSLLLLLLRLLPVASRSTTRLSRSLKQPRHLYSRKSRLSLVLLPWVLVLLSLELPLNLAVRLEGSIMEDRCTFIGLDTVQIVV